MNKLRVVAIVGSLLFFNSVFAGFNTGTPVTLGNDFGLYNAQGDMLAARTAANDSELIGCQLVGTEPNTAADFGLPVIEGSCQAVDADGISAYCFTTDPNLIETIASIDTYSYIRFFIVEDGDEDVYGGECARITVSNRSFYIPITEEAKEPKK